MTATRGVRRGEDDHDDQGDDNWQDGDENKQSGEEGESEEDQDHENH